MNGSGYQPDHTQGVGDSFLSGASERWKGLVADEASLASQVADESMLVSVAGAMQADTVHGITAAEAMLLRRGRKIAQPLANQVLDCVRSGGDPLGEAFCRLRSANIRRASGAIYTPRAIIDTMCSWAKSVGTPTTVVDPGTGSGRFLVAAGRCFPTARLLGIESDPVAALIARANLAGAGLSQRSSVRVENFLEYRLRGLAERALFIGNPPYVRHHLIPSSSKAWLKHEADQLGVKASALAGLHAYFFLAIAKNAKKGDFGSLITSAEWLDVNYGNLVREPFLGHLGGAGRVRHRSGGRAIPWDCDNGSDHNVLDRQPIIVGVLRAWSEAPAKGRSFIRA